MRPFTGLTLIGSLLLGAPDALWLARIPLNLMWLIHLLAFSLTVRLLFLCASIAKTPHDVVWVGFFAGAISGLISQLIIHTPEASTRIAASLADYSSMGLAIYQIDEGSVWWPFVLIIANIILYAGIGYLLYRFVRARHRRWLRVDRTF